MPARRCALVSLKTLLCKAEKSQVGPVLATYDIQREKCKLPLQLPGHVPPESHMKSR